MGFLTFNNLTIMSKKNKKSFLKVIFLIVFFDVMILVAMIFPKNGLNY